MKYSKAKRLLGTHRDWLVFQVVMKRVAYAFFRTVAALFVLFLLVTILAIARGY